MEEPVKRKQNRLSGYDYSRNGVYFLTICAKDREPIFGQLQMQQQSVGGGALDAPQAEGQVVLSSNGRAIQNWISDCDKKYGDLRVLKYVIMPNHIHLLLYLENGPSRAPAPTPGRCNERIPRLVSGMKRMTNKVCGCDLWQRGYHDHIVRNDADYLRIWQYIETNPAKWAEDKYYIR